MTTLCETYPSEAAARDATEAFSASSVPHHNIRLLIGYPLHDVRHEPVGGFGGPVDPDAPVGKFSGPPRARWRAAGGFYGNPDQQRQGSFADAERILIVSHDRGAGRMRDVSAHGTRRLLRAANVTDQTAERIIDELHHGNAVVLAEVADVSPREAQARRETIAHAA
jgi:hypothetical protein